MRGSFSAKPLARRAFVLAVLLAALAGCSSKPHWEIEAVGVVASENVTIVGTGSEVTYTFDDGRTYTMHYEWHVIPGDPPVGDLPIAGSKPSNWILAATPQHPGQGAPDDCYATQESYGEVHETSVDLFDGVTLPKAPNYFDPGGRYPNGAHLSSASACLDRQGRVTYIGPGRG
jgi:hypothetical protein